MERCLAIPELQKIDSVSLYETPQRYLLVGSCGGAAYRLVKVDRSDPSAMVLVEDQHEYTLEEMNGVLAALGAKKTCTGVGVLGFVKFVQGWYLLILVAGRQVGLVGSHKVFAVDDSAVVPFGVLSKEENEMTRVDEARYKRLFFGIDLTSFYYSYTYNLTRPLQRNMCSPADAVPDEKFCWNWYLSKPVREQLSARWFLPIIQGFVGSSTYSAHFDTCLRFTLISRRSQFYAGTRYLKRGISDAGHVANDVETEQIVQELLPVWERDRPHFSSFVQVRGSVPLFWAQENTFAIPKPDVSVVRGDPFHEAAIMHFQDLLARFGAPIMILNLVKHHEKRPRETILLDGFSDCVDTVNTSLPPDLQMVYIAWDFHARTKKEEVAGSLVPIARESIRRTGFFHTGTLNGQPLQQREQSDDPHFAAWEGRDPAHCRGRAQQGVLRSNCVDCLDRTNASQFCIGVAALGEQLWAMGLTASPLLEYRSQLVSAVLTLYEEMGDAIAVQYAGSLLAHRMNSYATSASKTASSTSRWGAVSKDLMTSIRRYYTSTFTDAEKQSSINLFLGRFRPYEHPAYEPLWELPSDAPLHAPPIAPHRRPLWTTRWWEGPLAEFGRQLAPFALPIPKPLPRCIMALPQHIEYSMEVSERFVRAYRPGQLTLFDDLLTKPFLRILRVPGTATGQSKKNIARSTEMLDKPESEEIKKKDKGGEDYARYLSAFASWVQGEVTRHLLPVPSAPSLPGAAARQQHAAHQHRQQQQQVQLQQQQLQDTQQQKAAQEAALSFKVPAANLAKYSQYVDFANGAVWEQRPGERAKLQSYLDKCNDTALVALSQDFVPSQAYYSGYLMDCATFSFSATHESLQSYQEYQLKPLPHVPTRIADIDPSDYALLFVEASSSRWQGDPHPLPRRF